VQQVQRGERLGGVAGEGGKDNEQGRPQRAASVQVCKCASVPGWPQRAASVQVCKCASVQVCKCAGVASFLRWEEGEVPPPSRSEQGVAQQLAHAHHWTAGLHLVPQPTAKGPHCRDRRMRAESGLSRQGTSRLVPCFRGMLTQPNRLLHLRDDDGGRRALHAVPPHKDEQRRQDDVDGVAGKVADQWGARVLHASEDALR